MQPGYRLDQAYLNRRSLGTLVQAQYCWGSDGSARRDALSDHAALLVDLRDSGTSVEQRR